MLDGVSLIFESPYYVQVDTSSVSSHQETIVKR